MLVFRTKNFSTLTLDELHDLLLLRSEVFVVEQDCVYQDVDGKDKKAIHVLGYKEDELVAYTRIFKAGDYFEKASFGRVVVKENARKFGYGHDLLKQTLHVMEKHFGKVATKISAQTYLRRFYKAHGFEQTGSEYLEDGIPHIAMLRP